MVHHYFNSRDSNLIFQIPLSVLGGPDSKVWGASSNGSFWVRSAYQIALSVLQENVGSALTEGSSFEGAKPGMWRLLWSIPTHRKIQLFLWQSLHKRISVNSLLSRRGISEISSCPFCEAAVETMDHLLCSCPFACLVLLIQWRVLVRLASFICRTIWKCRNDLIFAHRHWDPFKAAQKAHRDFFEFQEIQRQSSLLSLPSPTVVSVPSRWCVPALGCLKLNFDAAFDSSRKLCGGGMILQNHDGHPIRVASVFFSHVGDLSIAEALILRKSLSLLQLWGYQNVVVEGDCQPVTRLQPSAAALCVILSEGFGPSDC
ncbi:uncharacterized protein LOC132279952 [Cornus florida]|uniref:uncharacterized protein LOC132279952 n=1 Tax=Cornus florida TaxID=4283 RepID=UPI0028979324|nr:uncharacterized protein LOC132279952 [Cornus florida]